MAPSNQTGSMKTKEITEKLIKKSAVVKFLMNAFKFISFQQIRCIQKPFSKYQRPFMTLFTNFPIIHATRPSSQIKSNSTKEKHFKLQIFKITATTHRTVVAYCLSRC